MRAALLFLVALMLQGCAAQPFAESEVSASSPVAAAAAGNGVVAFSLAQADAQSATLFGDVEIGEQHQWRFEVRRLDDGRRFAFDGGAVVEKPTLDLLEEDEDEEDAIPGGDVYVHSLPPGAYEVATVYVWRVRRQLDGAIDRHWLSEDDVALPFAVEANGAHYLGEWRCVPKTSENAIGHSTMDGCAWEISDKLSRDAPILKKTYPGLPWNALENDTLRSGEAPAGLVAFK